MGDKKWLPWVIGCGAALVLGIGALLVVGALAWFGFLMPVRSTSSTPAVITVVVPAEQADVPTQAAQATEAPAPTPAPTEPATNAAYQNARFFLHPAVASSINGSTKPAVPPTQDGPFWDVAPEHIQIDLNGYALQGTFHHPSIYIYPAAEFEKMSPDAAKIIAELRQVLKEKPAQPERLPFLPLWNAGQVMHARVEYIETDDLTGVRYLTEFAQNFTTINNEILFYTFQGLSKDGKYYISMVLPANNPGLPDKADLSQQQYDNLAKDYSGYLNKAVADLEALPADSFKPALDHLDALVKSLGIK